MSKLIWTKKVRSFGMSGLLPILLGLAISPGTAGADPQRAQREREITVMTQNLYVGSHFEATSAATNLPELLQAVETDLADILATDVPGRMKAVARAAVRVRPDIIALQEAVIIRVGPPGDPAPAEAVLLDYAELVARELENQGLHYHPVAVFNGFDVELPAGLPPTMDVRITDRDVLLVRDDPETANIKITNSANGKYAAQASVPTLFGPVESSAGWARLDLRLRGQQIRIICTHLNTPIRNQQMPVLDPELVAIQQEQAAELIYDPANTELPVVILGDLNSTPDGAFTNSYLQLLDAGFVDSWDSWIEVPPDLPGPTCCQDGDLLNSDSALSVRIDHVLTRGGFNTRFADIIGEVTEDKTSSGLWPSDHAGVVAKLKLP